MPEWLSMYKAFPGLRGYRIHVVNVTIELLRRNLLAFGFKVYTIDGSRILDESTFFSEVARALDFPEYFGHNWDAWDECLGDFGRSLSADRVAIIWEHADQTVAADAQIFLQAVCDLYNLAGGVALYPMQHPEEGLKPKQMEVFFLGKGKGFNTQLELR